MNRLIVAMALAALAGTVSAQGTPAETTDKGYVERPVDDGAQAL